MTTKAPDEIAIATGVARDIADDAFTLDVLETDYLIRLKTDGRLTTPEGKRVRGVITAQGKRIDRVGTGGAFLEPVEGRPRRAQGRVRAIDKNLQTLTVSTGAAPIVIKTDGRQRAEEFDVGEMVTTSLEPGATFSARG